MRKLRQSTKELDYSQIHTIINDLNGYSTTFIKQQTKQYPLAIRKEISTFFRDSQINTKSLPHYENIPVEILIRNFSDNKIDYIDKEKGFSLTPIENGEIIIELTEGTIDCDIENSIVKTAVIFYHPKHIKLNNKL